VGFPLKKAFATSSGCERREVPSLILSASQRPFLSREMIGD
jgi:hypothetical protein